MNDSHLLINEKGLINEKLDTNNKFESLNIKIT